MIVNSLSHIIAGATAGIIITNVVGHIGCKRQWTMRTQFIVTFSTIIFVAAILAFVNI